MNTPVKEKLLELLDHLNHGLVERDSTLKAALLTMLAGENLLLVGPPGTAKSLIARKVAECLAHDGGAEHAGGYFEYLLTKFSTPEEIFGPLSISELKADRFKRNTAGYLPSVRMAFLDEIFKASSSILNALLTILNERLYHNGAEAQKVPLQALIAASNELPTGQEELDALYDRFLVRSFVDYVSEDNLPRLLDKPGPAPTITPLSSEDLAAIRQAAEAVTLPADIVSAIQKIWAGHKQMFKEDRRENLSDRRLRKVVGLLYISAATNGRKEVDLSDLLLLKDCLWNHPDNALKVRELVMNTLRTYSSLVPLFDTEQQPSPKAAAQQNETSAPKPSAKQGAVVKGYKGSGTEHDPILIENVLDLSGLERPEVGQQGYWFRQTADIDCSELTTWLNIDFQGHYDGGGHAIDFKENQWLFASVQNKSRIAHVRLNGLRLAETVSGSEIFACESSDQLLGDVTDCTISQCQSESVLIGNTATRSTIRDCKALVVRTLVGESGVNSSGNYKYRNYGGIASRLTQLTVVERCLVTGVYRDSNNVWFNGIAASCEETSTIRDCALGIFEDAKFKYLFTSRIANNVSKDSTLENNVALDCHGHIGESDPNGPAGKSLSAKLFTQHYFEHSLGWDFTNVWRWNDVSKQPELRAVGVEAVKQRDLNAASCDMGDLLTQQLTANLWL